MLPALKKEVAGKAKTPQRKEAAKAPPPKRAATARDGPIAPPVEIQPVLRLSMSQIKQTLMARAVLPLGSKYLCSK